MKSLVKKTLYIPLLILLLISCESNRRSSLVYLYSKDKTQSITVFSDYYTNERIIALGKLNTKPTNDYVKLDISEVTELGDEIGICWLGKRTGWQFVNDNSKIVEVSIDTTKYRVKTQWYRDEDNIPNAKYYRLKNCFTIGMLKHSRIYPSENGYIERN
ncbi:hypothetical protein [Flavobacterium quisquiliarum]|uniref:Lipoprotein n=1 Tax=Flavobacterium quisquiliarum TaxID=1834436 RepID=A0ABV8WFM6_9FLAO|nr:hypothetical protein [Flavobacterium quisquiliarum]MBW1654042.1 hypothetical protein [Flavobacterium quisquiliarum]NWL04197.1 hypothetical protein [Flavobacterium collinsii]